MTLKKQFETDVLRSEFGQDFLFRSSTIGRARPRPIPNPNDDEAEAIEGVALDLFNGDSMLVPMTAIRSKLGHNINKGHLGLLRKAEIQYYVVEAVEGEEFRFRPTDRRTQKATATNTLSTIHLLFLTDEKDEELEDIPVYDGSDDVIDDAEPNPNQAVIDAVITATSLEELHAIIDDAENADLFKGKKSALKQEKDLDVARDATIDAIS